MQMRPQVWLLMMTLLAAVLSSAAALSPSAALRAETHFTRIVSAARQQPAFNEVLDLTPSYIVGTLAFNMAAHVTVAREMAVLLGAGNPPTLFAAGIDANLLGLAWGVPAALVVASIEAWRCDDGCSVGEAAALACPRCSALTNPVLIGTAPLAYLSHTLLNDNSIGERAVDILSADEEGVRSFDGAPKGLPSSTTVLAAGGALVSCAWAQGLFQSGACTAFHEATMRVAMNAIASAHGDAWLETGAVLAMAARTALEPAAVIVLTTGLVAAIDTLATRSLQPVATATERATVAALDDAKPRATRLFSLEAPTDEAQGAAKAFEEQVAAWEANRDELTRRDRIASGARALVAATAFAASGGCLLAPIIGSLGVVASFDDVPFVGRQLAAEASDDKPPVKTVVGFAAVATAWTCGLSVVNALATVAPFVAHP